MSIINQMLKDLEQRAKPQIIPSTVGLKSAPIYENRWEYVKPILVIASIVLLVCALLGLIHHQLKAAIVPHYIKKTTPTFIAEKTNQSAIPAEDNMIHGPASAVTGLTLQVQKDKTVIRILLSQEALYHVNKNANGQYVIILNHAQLINNLPSINTFNSAIQDIHMRNTAAGDLFLLLTPKMGAELKRLELVTEGKYPELQIDLIAKDIPTVENSLVTQNAVHPILPPPLGVKEPINNIENQMGLTKSLVMLGPDEEYQQALQFSAQGNPNKAIDILSSLVFKFPQNALARETLAKMLLEQGKDAQANSLIQTGLQLKPSYAPFAEIKARILVKEGQVSDALELLQSSAPAIQNNPEYHAFIAALYQRQGQSQLAAKLYEQLLPYQPDNAMWWMGLGIAYEDLGKRNEATQAYVKAERIDKLNPELKAFVESRIHSLQ